ncbi:XRE family transcriptional regulator [Vibrio vulnificus]|uniref:helix-turn-helix domain-containing protein n=1 Tax=Vibrio vulnificus TaxID=672 RepID=UPI001CDD229B|nr:XRE family transcriptional regulator [Vibrio vulnificus]EHY9871081.1 XRE family transcriptional regulator [Vibrio vulnificus]EIC2761729.1 XRE family transcriptional regulator [Vibrio vulnificus]MCA3895333.1 XRE family transcriptional regulator [Vibrio vulnificus]MCU8238575.1 helix-turn-helix domain-containing protein [Vibrio vulnificus]
MTSISFDSMIEEVFTPFEIVEIDIKSKLFTIINTKIHEKGWSQKEAALELEVTQPRISNIKNSHHDKFSIEALMKLADRLGCQVSADTSCENGLTISIEE